MRPMRIALTVGATLMAAAGVAVVISVAAAAPSDQKNDAFKMPSTSAGPLSLAGGTPSPSPSPTASAAPTAVPSPASTAAPTAVPPVPASTKAPAVTAKPAATAAPAAAAPAVGRALPLSYSTGAATQVITVVAPRTSSTTATLQAWDKAPGGGWLPHGGAVTAHIGSQGMTTSPSETKSATPIGSFSLTRAFGANSNPGTTLPYLHTNADDWWISQPGPLYNTLQNCSVGCGSFTFGSPNEHLFYETPYYNYAVVIDYNVSPVVQGAGSAFFLHVTDGTATAGCVSIPQATLTSLMQWLTPSRSPRIIIGT